MMEIKIEGPDRAAKTEANLEAQGDRGEVGKPGVTDSAPSPAEGKSGEEKKDPKAAAGGDDTAKENAGSAEGEGEPETKTAGEAPPQEDPEARATGLQEQLLRLGAEFDNYKKRAERERVETAKYGTEQVLRAVLPTLDNLDRALQHSRDGNDVTGIREGLRITREELLKALDRFGLNGIDTAGQEFDPAYHEAIAVVASEAHKSNQVVSEMQKGFTLHGRLLRPAQVVIAKGPEEQEASRKSAGEESQKDSPEDPNGASQKEASPEKKTAEA